jgi:hypothetical protein
MVQLAARTSPSRNFGTTAGSGASQMAAILLASSSDRFVNLQRALLARQSPEEGEYSGVRIGQRLARP